MKIGSLDQKVLFALFHLRLDQIVKVFTDDVFQRDMDKMGKASLSVFRFLGFRNGVLLRLLSLRRNRFRFFLFQRARWNFLHLKPAIRLVIH
jgi:hypothetical protein